MSLSRARSATDRTGAEILTGSPKLKKLIVTIYDCSHQTYGEVRVNDELREEHEIRVGRQRVARLMRELELKGVPSRAGKRRTTIPDPKQPPASGLVERNFNAERPNALWLADITYVPTLECWLFLAVVIDTYSRKIVGWSMRDDLKAELVLDALGMAVSVRGGDAAGVVAHSDHGSQYTSLVYGTYAKQSGIDLSMGSIGDPWDNALAETFFASLTKELLHRERFPTREQARLRIFWYIECFYNPRRRHSSLGMLSPIDYEHRHQQEAIAA